MSNKKSRRRRRYTPPLPSLNNSWELVRRGLVRACGIEHKSVSQRKTNQDDPRTRHCFQDSTHLECCAPSRRTFGNTNADHAAPGISSNNGLPLQAYNGRWCTCLSGEVCRNQFHQVPVWIAVWSPPSFRKVLIVRDNTIIADGYPRGKLPPLQDRVRSWYNYTQRHGNKLHRVQARTKRRVRSRQTPSRPIFRSSIHGHRSFFARTSKKRGASPRMQIRTRSGTGQQRVRRDVPSSEKLKIAQE